MVVEWTPDAQKDLIGIWEYYDPRNHNAAVKIFRAIDRGVTQVGKMPLGFAVERTLDDMPGQHRSTLIMRTYKVIFKVVDQVVYIVAVWDCRRNPDTLRRRVR